MWEFQQNIILSLEVALSEKKFNYLYLYINTSKLAQMIAHMLTLIWRICYLWLVIRQGKFHGYSQFSI